MNKQLFSKTQSALGILIPISYSKRINTFREFLKKGNHMLGIPKIKSILSIENSVILLLSTEYPESVPSSIFDQVKTIFDVDLEVSDHSDMVQLCPNVLCSKLSYSRINIFPITLNLGYENQTRDQLLKSVIPEGIEGISSFETVGHIAHLNLKEELLPFKLQIGQIILDTLPSIRTVVNKIGTIDSTYRFFKMEILAGEDDMVATVREQQCEYKFDFSKVYWNSRLHHEHERIVNVVKHGDYVCDMFAGVGPFAIPLMKLKHCHVYASDLNPESYKWLLVNYEKNPLKKRKLDVSPYIRTFNMDAKSFIKFAIDDLYKEGKVFNHFIMNLPGSSLEFLPYFRDCYSNLEENVPLPLVHCYFFAMKESTDSELQSLVEKHLGSPVKIDNIHNVRNVSASKDMFCVSFYLPADVIFDRKKT